MRLGNLLLPGSCHFMLQNHEKAVGMIGKEATSAAMSGNETVLVKRDLQWGQGLQPRPHRQACT